MRALSGVLACAVWAWGWTAQQTAETESESGTSLFLVTVLMGDERRTFSQTFDTGDACLARATALNIYMPLAENQGWACYNIEESENR